MIGEIVKQLIGLFVDDEFLAVAILAIVAVAGALAFAGVSTTWLPGLILDSGFADGARLQRAAQRMAGAAAKARRIGAMSVVIA